MTDRNDSSNIAVDIVSILLEILAGGKIKYAYSVAALVNRRIVTSRNRANIRLATFLGRTTWGEWADGSLSTSVFVNDTAALNRIKYKFSDSADAAGIRRSVTVRTTIVVGLGVLDDDRSSN